MDIILIIIAALLMFLGIIGSFLPVLPGPLTSWLGLLVLHFTDAIPIDQTFLIITLVIAIFIWLLDYIIPALGTKQFGGTRYGMIGSTIGLIVGLITPIPGGIIIGPFLGALIGELINKSDKSSYWFFYWVFNLYIYKVYCCGNLPWAIYWCSMGL